MADSRRLAKNTLYMYLRMMLLMLVSLYTSRVVLHKMGVDDYGLYNAVASVVAMVAFLNSTLHTSTSRFLTYDLGIGDKQRLRNTFSTAFFTHLMLVGIIILSMETVGLWYLAHKFVVPEGRESAVRVVFQISILSTAISVCQVPFTALIIAHERMSIYAFVSIFQGLGTLGVAFLLSVSNIDKMILYAILLALVAVLTFSLYLIICSKLFPESHLQFFFDSKQFKRMLGFTGWTAVGETSNVLMGQGTVLLLNLYFPSAVISAKAVSNQVSSAIAQFATNFRVAMNPQIIKSYAVGNYTESRRLMLKSATISFDLLLIIGMPFIFTMDFLLDLWLVEVPPYAVVFSQYAVATQILNVISSSMYISFVAAGQLKLNAIWGLIESIFIFVALYFAFKWGGSVMWLQYLTVISVLIVLFLLRPILLHKEIDYSFREIVNCYWECLKPAALAVPISILASCFFKQSLLEQIGLFLCVFVSSLFSVLVFMDKGMKRLLFDVIKKKFYKKT